MADSFWLLRKTKGEILGPMSGGELRALLLKSAVPRDAEFCQAGSDWFSLQDIEELKKHFNNDEIAGALRAVNPDIEGSTRSDITRNDVAVSAQTPKEDIDRRSPREAREPVHQAEQGSFLGIAFFLGIVAAIFLVIWLIRQLNASQ